MIIKMEKNYNKFSENIDSGKAICIGIIIIKKRIKIRKSICQIIILKSSGENIFIFSNKINK